MKYDSLYLYLNSSKWLFYDKDMQIFKQQWYIQIQIKKKYKKLI